MEAFIQGWGTTDSGSVSDGDDRRGQKLKTQEASKCLILKNFPGLGSQIVEMTRKCNAPCKRTQCCWPTTSNIVGCYMLRPFAHPVACCWMLLRVVAQSLKPVKLFSQQLPTFLLFRDRWNVAQQCWIRLHRSSLQVFQHCWGHARSLRMVYKD